MPTLKLHSSKLIDIYSALTETKLELPYVESGISAGFPSPALDFVDLTIDLISTLSNIPHPHFTVG